jgi:nucleotide-binding universal stress UspA family protein
MTINIVVPVDLSEASERVIDFARLIGAETGGAIWLIHVADEDPSFVGLDAGPGTVRQQAAKTFRDEHKRLQAEAERLRSKGLDVTALLLQGPIVETLLAEAERLGADVMIVGSHGHGALYDLVVGSVSQGLLKDSTVPVLVVPVRAAS